MNNVGLSFCKQIVPVKSETPISPQEKAELEEMKKIFDEKVSKDIVTVQHKDQYSYDIVVNDPQNPKKEKQIAEYLTQMAQQIHPAPKATAVAPVASTATKPQGAGKSFDTVA